MSKTIFAALVAAQKNFEAAAKTSNNPHFRSKYAALDVCVDAVKEALNNEGLYLLQKTHACDDGVIVETIFIHESGDQISGGLLHVPASKHDAQGYGSALTYARRYSLLAACGIAPEDDDGNAATKTAPKFDLASAKAECQSKLESVTDKTQIKEIANGYRRLARQAGVSDADFVTLAQTRAQALTNGDDDGSKAV